MNERTEPPIMTECKPLIKKGFVLRNVLTLLSLYVIYFYLHKKSVRKYLYLILPVVLTLMDNSDNFFMYSVQDFVLTKKRKCAKTFDYHHHDKISDSLAYAFAYFFIFLCVKHDPFLLFFVLYRIVGVFVFSYTKNSKWLVLFFDFVKEYFLYLFLFGRNWKYLPFFITLKMVFEYLFHSIINPSHY